MAEGLERVRNKIRLLKLSSFAKLGMANDNNSIYQLTSNFSKVL